MTEVCLSLGGLVKTGGIGSLRSPFPLLLNLQEKILPSVASHHLMTTAATEGRAEGR